MLGKCIVLGMLAWLTREDIRSGELPVFWIILPGLGGVCIFLYCHPYSMPVFLGGIAVGLLLLLISFAGKGAVGRGDGYLFCVTGVFLGIWENLFLLLGALVIAAVYAAGLLLVRRCGKKERFPFIPFVLAAYLLLLLGQECI